MLFEDKLSDYASLIVRGIVDHPEEVDAKVYSLSSRYVVEVRTSPDDIGQVIGRMGVVIRSVRCLIEAFGGCQGKVVTMDYPTEKERPPKRRVDV